MKTLLWLDDIRDPEAPGWANHINSTFIGIDNVVWVRSYNEFTSWITENGIPYAISFDHDLADIHYDPMTMKESFEYYEKTGYDCVIWFGDYLIDNGYKHTNIPIMESHSANPVGRDNIYFYIKFIRKFLNPDYKNVML